MNRETPNLPDPPQEPDSERLSPEQNDVFWSRALPPHRKFQHNYPLHLLLFGLTFITTTWIWTFPLVVETGSSVVGPFWRLIWATFVNGLWYSVPLLTILSAHEFGHYFACRYYNVDATLPYYLPSPLPPAGTFGAVIRIREAFPSKKALFDIGIAGPIAGFVVLIPFLIAGLMWSHVAPIPPGGALYFGEPLLFKVLARLRFGVVPEGSDVFLHPVGLAAWWGMFATFLNLLPFGQLDGGHIAYAAVGRRSNLISAATLIVVLLLTLESTNWILMALIMLGASFTFGFGHPRVIDEDAPLDRTRQWLTVFAILMFVLCFMPVPISIGR